MPRSVLLRRDNPCTLALWVPQAVWPRAVKLVAPTRHGVAGTRNAHDWVPVSYRRHWCVLLCPAACGAIDTATWVEFARFFKLVPQEFFPTADTAFLRPPPVEMCARWAVTRLLWFVCLARFASFPSTLSASILFRLFRSAHRPDRVTMPSHLQQTYGCVQPQVLDSFVVFPVRVNK